MPAPKILPPPPELKRLADEHGAKEIAARYGVSVSAIGKSLRRHGLEYEPSPDLDLHNGGRGQRRNHHPRRDEALTRLARGEKRQAVADDIGVSYAMLDGWMRYSWVET